MCSKAALLVNELLHTLVPVPSCKMQTVNMTDRPAWQMISRPKMYEVYLYHAGSSENLEDR